MINWRFRPVTIVVRINWRPSKLTLPIFQIASFSYFSNIHIQIYIYILYTLFLLFFHLTHCRTKFTFFKKFFRFSSFFIPTHHPNRKNLEIRQKNFHFFYRIFSIFSIFNTHHPRPRVENPVFNPLVHLSAIFVKDFIELLGF